MAALRLVFLGSDAIALPLLEWLAGEGAHLASVIGVFTQPDRPVGRGQRVQPNAIKSWALERGLPVLQPDKLTEEVRRGLVELRADAGLIMAYGHILREDFISTPRLGMLNLHTSLLPSLRGASPIQTAVASGAPVTGVSLMKIVRRLDAGPVADREPVAIGPLDTALEVEGRLASACVPLLARALPRLADGSLTFVEQTEAAATFCRKLRKEDGVLDFTAPAGILAARINGLFPWPGCTVTLAGQPVRIGQADVLPDPEPRRPTEPGVVTGADASGLLVSTGGGLLRLRRLQRPGGRMLEAVDFLRGFPVAPGTRLPSVPMPGLVTSA